MRVVVLSEYSTHCSQEYPKDQTHDKSCLFLPPPRSGLQWEPYHYVALEADGGRGIDTGIHVDEMYVNEESAEVCLRHAVEGIIDPEGKEEDEGKIGYSQVQHVDVRVRPGLPFGDEGPQSSGIDKETQHKHHTITYTLKGVHSASGGIEAHSGIHP